MRGGGCGCWLGALVSVRGDGVGYGEEGPRLEENGKINWAALLY